MAGARVGAGATIIVVDATGAPVTGEAERRLEEFVNRMIAGGKLWPAAQGKLRSVGATR